MEIVTTEIECVGASYEGVQAEGDCSANPLGSNSQQRLRGWHLRMLHNGSASAFQADGASSILVIRSRPL